MEESRPMKRQKTEHDVRPALTEVHDHVGTTKPTTAAPIDPIPHDGPNLKVPDRNDNPGTDQGIVSKVAANNEANVSDYGSDSTTPYFVGDERSQDHNDEDKYAQYEYTNEFLQPKEEPGGYTLTASDAWNGRTSANGNGADLDWLRNSDGWEYSALLEEEDDYTDEEVFAGNESIDVRDEKVLHENSPDARSLETGIDSEGEQYYETETGSEEEFDEDDTDDGEHDDEEVDRNGEQLLDGETTAPKSQTDSKGSGD